MRATTPTHKQIRWTPALRDIVARGWRNGVPTKTIIKTLEAHPDTTGKHVSTMSVWSQLNFLRASQPDLKRSGRMGRPGPIDRKRLAPAQSADNREHMLVHLGQSQIARLLELLLSPCSRRGSSSLRAGEEARPLACRSGM